LFEESLTQRRALGDKAGMGVALCNLGELALRRGEIATARELLEESLSLRRELGDKLGLGFTLSALAAVSRREGDPAAAWRLLTESLELRREISDKPGIADCLERGAMLAIAQAQPLLSARLFGAAEALREDIGAPLTPAARAEYDHEVAALRASLGETTLAAGWAEGRSMSLEEAIDRIIAPLTAEQPITPSTAAPSDAARGSRTALPDGLTAREAEVLALIAEGIGNQAIAERLVVSLRTVEHHIASIYRKIGARGRADAVAYALRNGLG
jgi:DNA-binding CsgD family transcriptional regulator